MKNILNRRWLIIISLIFLILVYIAVVGPLATYDAGIATGQLSPSWYDKLKFLWCYYVRNC